MRISELSTQAGVPVATIKYYIREGLLPEGVRSAPTQASYGDAHVSRLRLIRALIDSSVSVAQARRVLSALDNPPENPAHLLAAAHAAVAPAAEPEIDTTAAERIVEMLGWRADLCDPDVLAEVARALGVIDRAGFTIPDDVLPAYVDAVSRIARAEIAGVPLDSPEAAVRYVVLGTVLNEPLLLALRRVAQQVASAERFGTD